MHILFNFLLGVAAWAQTPTTVSQIQSIVVEKDLSRLEDVVRFIPEDLRRNFTLVYAGKALIRSDAEYPGVIMFGDSAKVLLAFNGRPEHQGHHALDVLEYDEATGFYKPARFWFSPTDKEKQSSEELTPIGHRNVYLEKNPRVCAHCHGQNHHPIFEQSYPTWAGFYGSSRDHIYGHEGREERPIYEKFLREGRLEPRYQPLIFPSQEFSTVTPFLDEYTEEMLGFVRSLEYRPNLRFGAYVARRNSFGLFQVMKSSPHYEKYKKLFAFVLQPCDFSEMDQAELLRLKTEVEHLADQLGAPAELELGSSFLIRKEYELNRTFGAKIAWILGLRPDHWNLARRMLRTNEYRDWSGYGGTQEFLYTHLTRDIFADDWSTRFTEKPVPLPLMNEVLPSVTPVDASGVCGELM